VLTSNNRIRTLDAIHDLGLKVHAWRQNFFQVIPYSMGLACCYDFRRVASVEDTEDVLNAAKISPRLYNAQAPGGLSWGVADVMASNACLISPYKKDLDLISPYIKIPNFESPGECRDLCQKLLKDEMWRRDIVAGCQKAINERSRFCHLFAKIAEAVKINLGSTPVESKNENRAGTDYITLNSENCSFIPSHKYKKIVLTLVGLSVKFLPKEVVKSVYLYVNRKSGFTIDQSSILKLRKYWVRRKTD